MAIYSRVYIDSHDIRALIVTHVGCLQVTERL